MKTRALILFLLIGKFSFSQIYTNEAAIFSQTGISGTARSAGVGGAFGAVGADLGGLDINPAGLGFYRSSEFSITPGLKVSNDAVNYDGNSTSSSLPRLYLSQGGLVWTKILRAPSKSHEISFEPHRLRSITFALNYQTDNFYARSQNYAAINNNSSLIDNYTNFLNSNNISAANVPFPEAYLALIMNLIGVNPTTGKLVSNAPAPVSQTGDIETRGSNQKINIGFGGNVNDKLYFGLGISVPFVNYTSTTNFTEQNASDSVPSFVNYNLSSVMNVSGVGFTGNLGLIYRPVTWLRLGVAYHLPTWYSMNESYNSNILATWDTANVATTYYTDPQGYPTLNYNFRTPMKGVFSASFFLKQIGFLSVDYQLQNMASSRFNFGSGNEALTQEANDSVKAWYTIQHTIRVGIEGAYKILRLRAGYAYTSSPFKSSAINYMEANGYTGAVQNITAGIGLRFDHFYIDFAYVYSFSKDVTYPFEGISDNVYNHYNTSTALLTLGWKMNSQGSRNRRNRSNNNTNSLPPQDDQKY